MTVSFPVTERLDRPGRRTAHAGADANQFLAALPEEDRSAIASVSAPIPLVAGEPIWDAGETIDEVFFPTHGLMAEMVLHADGRTGLARLAGPEGLVGALAGASTRPAIGPVMALTPCEGLHVDAQSFAGLLRERRGLRAALDAYWARMVEEISVTAGCAACHKLDQRLPGLLLACGRRSGDPRLALTHDTLCHLLGAQRTTVTSLMRALKADGAVRTGRGWIKVTDESALVRRSCDCHARSRPSPAAD